MKPRRSEKTVDSIIKKINDLKHRLELPHKVVERKSPQLIHLLPSAEEVIISKLDVTLFTTDNCNTAQKSKKIFAHEAGGITYGQACHHHLRNMWLKGLEKDLTNQLNVILCDSLDEIPPKLRVATSFSAMCRTYDKLFSLSCNYVKGKGEDFAAHL